MDKSMDPTSACGGQADMSAIYETMMARRALNQQRVEGAAAIRLIQSSLPAGQAEAPLPPDATISVRA